MLGEKIDRIVYTTLYALMGAGVLYLLWHVATLALRHVGR